MKIERRTDGTLWLTESAGVLRWGLLACVFAGAGGALAVAFGRLGITLTTREWLVLGGVVAVCAAGALWAPTTEIEIAPWKQQVRIQRTRLLGAHERLIAFGEIRSVDVIEHRSRNDRGRPVVTHRIALATASDRVMLSVVNMRSELEATSLAGEIRSLLAIRAEDVADVETRIRRLVEAGQRIDAIALAREHYGFGLVEAERLVRGMAGDEPSRGA